MKIIIDNIVIIFIIGLFIVFSLIGYLIELIKQSKKKEVEEIFVEEIHDNNIFEEKETKDNVIKKIEEETKKELKDNGDDLLNNYENN